jgi:hypothetical protein
MATIVDTLWRAYRDTNEVPRCYVETSKGVCGFISRIVYSYKPNDSTFIFPDVKDYLNDYLVKQSVHDAMANYPTRLTREIYVLTADKELVRIRSMEIVLIRWDE